MIKDLAKDFHMTPVGAKSVAFDCINEISDLYGHCPEEANAMIKGARYYLGYLQQAGAFECENEEYNGTHEDYYNSGYERAISDVIIEMCADCKKNPCWDAMPEGCYQYDKLKEMRDKYDISNRE